jgi:predicted nucleic acid-binding protein
VNGTPGRTGLGGRTLRGLLSIRHVAKTLRVGLRGLGGNPTNIGRRYEGLTLADSLQIATAVQANCQALLTNDAALARVTEVRILVVGSLQL